MAHQVEALPDPQLPLLLDHPLVANEEVGQEEGRPKSILTEAATILQEGSSRAHFDFDLDQLGARIGVGRKALADRLHAVSEVAVEAQKECCNAVFKLGAALERGGAMVQVAVMEHIVYDETPLVATIRFGGQKHVEKAKLFVVNVSWSSLLRKVPVPAQALAAERAGELQCHVPENYLLISGRHSCCVRAGETTAGEGVVPILNSAAQPAPESANYQHRFRCIESDEHGGNKRAECIIAAERASHGRVWQRLSFYCAAHKCHKCAEKTWQLSFMAPVVSGVLSVGLLLQHPGAMKTLRESLRRVLSQRPLHILYRAADLNDNRARRHLVNLFAPPAHEAPRRRALIDTFAEKLLNGRWGSNHLEHVCGPGCCASEEETRLKILAVVPQVLTAVAGGVFQRGDWKNWVAGTRLCGLMQGIHGVFAEAFLHAFGDHVAPGEVGNEFDAQMEVMDELLRPEQPGIADDGRENAYRAEKLRYQQQACEFLRSEDWHAKLVVLVQALLPERCFMSFLLSGTSAAHEAREQAKLQRGEPRKWRVLELHGQQPLREQFQAGLHNFQTDAWWRSIVTFDTEEFRSQLFVSAMRPILVLYQLLMVPLRGYPWKTFSLLENSSREHAAMILQSPRCMMDAFTKYIVDSFPTVDHLSRDTDLQQLLAMMAQQLVCTSFQAERAHSSNARFSRGTAHTNVKTVEQLAWRHVGLAAAPWIQGALKVVEKELVAEEQKLQRGVAVARPEPKRQKRRRGGGGPWRAYQYHRCTVLGEKVDARGLKAGYRELPAAERAFYNVMGQLGLERALLCRVGNTKEVT